jgi:hypothetical protein
MKTLSSGHHKVKPGWKLLAGLPKKRGRDSAVMPQRKPSPASPFNCACNRLKKPKLTNKTEQSELRFDGVTRKFLRPSCPPSRRVVQVCLRASSSMTLPRLRRPSMWR